MPTVRIRYLGAFADTVRSKEETCSLTACSLSALVNQLLERNGEKFRALMINPNTGNLRTGTTLLVNGHRRDLEHELSDGDEITLLTPVAGGNHGKSGLGRAGNPPRHAPNHLRVTQG